MAYTIISQNNNTTTLTDGVNTITVPSRVNLTSGNFTIVEVNNNMATLEDGDGNVYRDIPCVATLVDAGGGGSSLPDQTGHSGEFLTTDGTDASWSDKPLQNTATSEDALTILGTPSTLASQKRSINIGVGSSVADSESVVIGRNATSSSGKTVNIGAGSQTHGLYTVAIGANAQASATPAIAIGYGATASAVGAIMIGGNTNSEANTVKINSYKVLDSDGTIPTARLTNAINKYSSMPTAGADYLGQIAQFTGTTDATYTHGYIYECVSDGGNPATYSWTAVSVQAGGSSLPSQTGNSGKFLTTDGTDASWSDKPLVNKATGFESLAIGSGYTGSTGSQSVAIGPSVTAGGFYGIGIGNYVGAGSGIAIGRNISIGSSGYDSIVIGKTNSTYTNNDPHTFKIVNENGKFEMMSADGTIPADRLASTTGLADGNYRLRLTMTSGVPTLSWVAE